MATQKINFLLLGAIALQPVDSNADDQMPLAKPLLEQHQACHSNAECTSTQRECSDCDCGTPLNVKYKTIYIEEKRKRCENYKGAVCDLICQANKAECENEKCVMR